MKRICLPGTELSMSRLTLGTASLHHLPTSSQRRALLFGALDEGISHFDTAPYYGFGLAELEIGRLLAGRSSGVTIASKVGLYPPGKPAVNTAAVWLRKALGRVAPVCSAPVVDWSVARASNSLENSLRRLRRDCIDLLFLHEPSPGLLRAEEFLNWLSAQRKLGKLRYWGLAGPAEHLKAWIQDDSQLAQVLQVRDDLTIGNDHPVLKAGRAFQLTYGYLSNRSGPDKTLTAGEIVRAALVRNRTGAVVISSRRLPHLRELVTASESS